MNAKAWRRIDQAFCCSAASGVQRWFVAITMLSIVSSPLDPASAEVDQPAIEVVQGAQARQDLKLVIDFFIDRGDPVVTEQAAFAAVDRLGDERLRVLIKRYAEYPARSLRNTALQRIGAYGKVDPGLLVEGLQQDQDPEVREACVMLLSGSAAPSSTDRLIAMLGDDAPVVRRSLRQAFDRGRSGPDPEVCLKVMRGDDTPAKMELLRVGVVFDAEIQSKIVRHALGDPDYRVREMALKVNLWLGGKASFDQADLDRAAKDKQPSVRVAAAMAVLSMDWQRPPALLQQLADDPDPVVREGVATALGISGKRDVSGMIKKMMSDEQLPVRLAMARSLSVLEAEDADELLVAASREEDPGLQFAALKSLAARGSARFASAFKSVFRQAEGKDKWRLIKLVRYLGPDRARTILDRAVSAADLDARIEVAKGLPSLPADLRFHYAEVLSGDESQAIRIMVVRYLAKYVDEPAAAAILEGALEDSDPVVVLIAKSALRK